MKVMLLSDMAPKVVPAVEGVIASAASNRASIRRRGVVDRVDMAAKVFRILGGWCFASGKTTFIGVGGNM